MLYQVDALLYAAFKYISFILAASKRKFIAVEPKNTECKARVRYFQLHNI
jgi:hypothetical protein